jgi:hypothetical protein
MYEKRLSYKKYDDTHYIVYLNETVTENYQNEEGNAFTAYSYAGTLSDGGTVIEINPNEQLQNALINGIIRAKYTLSEEDAIKTHQFLILANPEHNKADEYRDEFARFNEFRENCITTVRNWFNEG